MHSVWVMSGVRELCLPSTTVAVHSSTTNPRKPILSANLLTAALVGLIIWLDTQRLTYFIWGILRSEMNQPRSDLAAGFTETRSVFLANLNFE